MIGTIKWVGGYIGHLYREYPVGYNPKQIVETTMGFYIVINKQ